MKRTYLFGSISIFIALLFLQSCGSEKSRTESLPPAVAVKTIRVSDFSGTGRILYSGTVKPLQKATIAGKLMGTIRKIFISEGDFVKRGDLLIQLESREMDARLAQAEAGLSAANIAYENALKNLNRFEALYKEGAATDREMENIRLAFQNAEAMKKGAEAQRNSALDLNKFVRIAAPFSGIISKKFVNAGDLAKPGQPLLTLESTGKYKLEMNIAEKDISGLSLNQTVSVEIPSSDGGPYQGTISNIVRAADPGNHQFRVKILLQETNLTVKPGMFARVSFRTNSESSLYIPKTSIIRRGQLTGVYVVDAERRARLRWIRTGIEKKNLVEVLAGLNPNEEIVVNADSGLLDGQPVEVVK